LLQDRADTLTGARAIEDYTRAIVLRETWPSFELREQTLLMHAYLNRGIDRLGIDAPELAVVDFDRVIELGEALAPTPSKTAFLARAYQLRAQARVGEDAMVDLGRAIALRLDAGADPAERVELIRCYCRRGLHLKKRGQLETAIEDFTRAIEVGESISLSQLGNALALADAYHQRGDATFGPASISDYLRAIELREPFLDVDPRLQPVSVDCYSNLGFEHLRLREFDSATAAFTSAIELAERREVDISIAHKLTRAYLGRAELRGAAEANADFSTAIALSERFSALDRGFLPGLLAALTGRGSRFLRDGQQATASEDFSRAIEIGETLDLALPANANTLADVYCRRGLLGSGPAAVSDYTRAIGLYETLIRSAPELRIHLADALVRRGNEQGRLSKFDAAIDDFDRAIEVAETLDLESELAADVVARAHQFRADLRTGDDAVSDYTRAIECWEPLAASAKRYRLPLAFAHRNRASILALTDRKNSARNDLERAVAIVASLDVTLPDNAHLLANWLQQRADLDSGPQAIADYTRAIELWLAQDLADAANRTRLRDCYRNRAVDLQRIGDLTMALADFSRAIELGEGLDLSDPQAAAAQAATYGMRADLREPRVAVSDRSQAIELWTRVVAIDPRQLAELVASYVSRCVSLLNAGDRSAAVVDLGRAIQFEGSLDLSNLGDVQPLARAYEFRGMLGQGTESIADYTRAIALREPLFDSRPEHLAVLAASYRKRGVGYRAGGHLAEARADFSRAIELGEKLDGTQAAVADALANVYHLRGALLDPREAISDFSRAVQLREPFAAADADIRQSLAIDHENRGIAEQAAGQRKEALADFDRAIELNESEELTGPYNVRALARVYHRRGGVRAGEEAISDYTRAIQLRESVRTLDASVLPELGESYCNRGAQLSSRGALDQAVADFDQALAIAESEQIAPVVNVRFLANLYRLRGDALSGEAAISDYTRAIELVTKREAPDETLTEELAMLYRRRAKTRLANGQWELAHDDQRNALIASRPAWAFVVSPSYWTAIEDRCGAAKEALLTPEEAESLVSELTAIIGPERASHWPSVTSARIRRLPSLVKAFLLELAADREDGSSTVAHFLWRKDLALLLDGSSSPLHDASEFGWIEIGDPETALDYLRLFCSHVAAASGVFSLIENPAQIYWHEGAPADVRARVEAQLRLVEVNAREDGRWFAKASIIYEGALVTASFTVAGSEVTMIDDDMDSNDLPVRALTLRDGWSTLI
jgi:tetratricopeptide (TPR) repeat protein